MEIDRSIDRSFLIAVPVVASLVRIDRPFPGFIHFAPTLLTYFGPVTPPRSADARKNSLQSWKMAGTEASAIQRNEASHHCRRVESPPYGTVPLKATTTTTTTNDDAVSTAIATAIALHLHCIDQHIPRSPVSYARQIYIYIDIYIQVVSTQVTSLDGRCAEHHVRQQQQCSE